MALDKTLLALNRTLNALCSNDPAKALGCLDNLLETGYAWHCAQDVKSLRAIISGREALTVGQQSTACALVRAELCSRYVVKHGANGFIGFIGTPKEGYRNRKFRSGRWFLSVKKGDFYLVDRFIPTAGS